MGNKDQAAHTQLSADAPEAPVDTWERLAVEQDPSRLETFWDSLSTQDQAAVAARCPYFDPSHPVWSNERLGDAAFRELTQIMVDDRRDVMAGRLLRRTAWAVALVVIGGLLLIGTLLCSSRSEADKWILGGPLVFIAGVALGYAGVLAVYAFTAYKLHKRAPRVEYTPIARLGPTPLLADYEKNWGAIEHWKMVIRRLPASFTKAWEALSKAVDVGQLTSREKRQLFWDTQSARMQAFWLAADPHFDPSSDAWQSATPETTKRWELELDLVMENKTLQILYCGLGAAVLVDTVTVVICVPDLLGVAAIIVAPTLLSVFSTWQSLRRRAQLRRDLGAISEA